MCQQNQSSSQVKSSWLKNEVYELTETDREILKSKNGWLNDNLMNEGQQLICSILLDDKSLADSRFVVNEIIDFRF